VRSVRRGWRRVNDEERREIEGNSEFVFFSSSSHLSLFFYSLVHDGHSFFIFRNTKRLEIASQQHLYTPVAHFSPTSNATFQLVKIRQVSSDVIQCGKWLYAVSTC